MDFLCPYCNQVKQRIKTDKMHADTDTYISVDETGLQWSRRRCPECTSKYRKQSTLKRKNLGLTKDVDHKSATFQKGRQNELKLQQVFEAATGIKLVKNTETHGADFTFHLGDAFKTLEIKSSANRHVRHTVNRIRKFQRSRDYVGIVFSNGGILIEPMQEHISQCTPAGWRSWAPDEIPTITKPKIKL